MFLSIEKPVQYGFQGGQGCLLWFSGWTRLFIMVFRVN